MNYLGLRERPMQFLALTNFLIAEFDDLLIVFAPRCGICQTVFWNDLARNYGVFIVSMLCWMPLLYWRQQERLAAEVAEQKAKLAREKQAHTPAKPGKKQR
jgi:hypothetical protein